MKFTVKIIFGTMIEIFVLYSGFIGVIYKIKTAFSFLLHKKREKMFADDFKWWYNKIIQTRGGNRIYKFNRSREIFNEYNGDKSVTETFREIF